MRWIVAFLACIGIAQAQVVTHQIADDSWAHVPLQFPFPLHGRVFTDSYMFSNGVVGFGSVNQGWCCSGYDLANQQGYHLNYSILGLQTDLINYGSGRFTTEGTTTYQRYRWQNISEYGAPNNLNTFSIEIRPTGYIGIHHENINLSSWRLATVGITGDTTRGEYTQFYHGAGLVNPNPVSYITQSTGDLCLIDPLSSPSCPGYQQAYLVQQCSINSLYSTTCPGYALAYHDQQCSLNPLYATTCLGYEAAYFTYQCTQNPLYNSRCNGYAQAYFDNQCRLNALYDRTCPGYAEAYYNQQCSLNPLYDRRCPGYETAYALANVVSAPTVTVSAPTVQVSTTGTVAVETPVVSDPVVNEVITRPAATTTNATTTVQTPTAISPTSVTSQAAKEEPKTEKKPEPKQVATVKSNENKNEVSVSTPVIPTVQYAPPPVLIVDMLFKQMVKKPIQDNNRSYYALIMGSQKTHEEMVNEQYRKRD